MKIKSIITSLLLVAALVLGSRCSDDANVSSGAQTFSLSDSHIIFAKDGGEQNLRIESSEAWTAQLAEQTDWVKLTNASSSETGEVTITVEKNPLIEKRKINLLVKSGDRSEMMIVSQEAGDNALGLYNENDSEIFDLLFSNEGGSSTVQLKSNSQWTAQIEEGATWLSLNYASGREDRTIIFSAEANSGLDNRVAEVKFLVDDIEIATLSVEQGKGLETLTTNSDLYEISAYGATAAVDVMSNADWTVRKVVDDETTKWLTLATNGANGNAVLSAEAAENTDVRMRSVELEFSYGENTHIITISQFGGQSTISCDSNAADFNSESGQSKSFTIDSNDNCIIEIPESAQSWLKSDVADVLESGMFVLETTAANSEEGAELRSAIVKVYCENNPGTFVEIEVTQSSAAMDAALELSTQTLDFAKAANVYTEAVEVTSASEWSVDTAAEWLTLIKNGNFLDIDVAGNNTIEVREAVITITSGAYSKEIRVSQAAGDPGVEITADSTEAYEKEGGEKQISINANTNWLLNVEYAVDDEPWLTYLYSRGDEGELSMALTASENPVMRERRATLIFTTGGSSAVIGRYEVVQKQNVERLVLVASGQPVTGHSTTASGGLRMFNLESNTTWTAVSSDDTWLTLVDGDNKVIAGEQTGNMSLVANVKAYDTYGGERVGTITFSFVSEGQPKTVEYTVTQAGKPIIDPTYAISQINQNSIKLFVNNSSFAADTPSAYFDTTDFVLSYVNDYNGDVAMSGEIAVAGVDFERDDNGVADLSTIIITTDTFYNTDKITLRIDDANGSMSNAMFDTGTLVIAESAEANVATTYVEYINNNFEDGELNGWISVDRAASSYKEPNNVDVPIIGGSSSIEVDPEDVNNKAYKMTGMNSTSLLVTASETFNGDWPIEKIQVSYRYRFAEVKTIAGGLAVYVNKKVEDGLHDHKRWIDNVGTPMNWLATNNEANYAKLKDKWITVSTEVKPLTGGNNYDTINGNEVDYNDLRLIYNFNGLKANVYLDDVFVGYRELRPRP